MLAFLSVWIAVSAFVIAGGMFVYRPLFTDLTIVAVLWFASPGALCLGGLVLWAYRKDASGDPAIANQRLQAKAAIGMAVAAAAIVYWLIISSAKIEPR